MSWVLVFPQPTRPITLNDRNHWAATARIMKAWKHATWTHALTTGRSPSERSRPPCQVLVSFPVTTTRGRDAHNWMPTVKAIIDGLVLVDVWPDDTGEWVTVLDPEFHLVERGDPLLVHVTLIAREVDTSDQGQVTP